MKLLLSQETEKGVISSEKVKSTMEEKAIEQEPVTFASKLVCYMLYNSVLFSFSGASVIKISYCNIGG